ncbi:hypothetical protein M758_1G213700 [Ceratodon purpureus]|uniref:Uncharacterized protein n=1 Tax=Ceratodon purpureus TaxID=3225 RepID=A0A8T0JAW8_CERPU|nr:hypothetical protein KC19_1G207300 [Ceratodon purpureus]KAG0630918.1 hypothetical protein M758_1G213700 [Ceratodon purpureus]
MFLKPVFILLGMHFLLLLSCLERRYRGATFCDKDYLQAMLVFYFEDSPDF